MRRIRNILHGPLLAVLALAALTGATQASQKALVIGINTYPHLSPDYQLSGARDDALKMKDFLQEQWGLEESDILLLLDTDATKAAILDALNHWLPEQSLPGDRVVVYYSGHGTQVRDSSGDEADGMDEALAPSDTGSSAGDDDELIDDEIARAFARLAGREILFIADSCNSGTLSRSADFEALAGRSDHRERYLPPSFTPDYLPEFRDEEPLSREVGAQLTLSAAMPHQWAWESSGTGIFTAYLLEALSDLRADANGNGTLTSAEVINYIKPKTEAYCERNPRCRDMGFTPNMDPKNGAFVLMSAETSPAPGIIDDVTDILPEVEGQTITIDIRPSNTHRVGEEVRFSLASAVDGYLTLLDVTSSGELVLLFPKKEDIELGKAGRIRANSPLLLPDDSYGFDFVAQPPTGKGQLLAIVTHDRIDLGDLLATSGELEPIEDPLAYVQSLSQRLHEVWTGDADANRGASWAIGYAGYEILE